MHQAISGFSINEIIHFVITVLSEGVSDFYSSKHLCKDVKTFFFLFSGRLIIFIAFATDFQDLL